MLELRIDLDIRHVDKRALEDRPPGPEGPRWTRREYAIRCLEGFGGVVVLGDTVEQLAVELIERAKKSVAQPHGASDDRVEDRLHVGLRAADHAEDLARRRLLLERLAHLCVSLSKRAVLFLELGKQAHVFDGDHGLIGKNPEELELSVRERLNLRPEQDDGAERNTFAKQ